mmetsp:Transcript_40051/g.80320  ORF Transcript_40051/g.80320 Transcript_40051/m.80320 type:complete len:201 (-) Transcript_40051:635-1237(-)
MLLLPPPFAPFARSSPPPTLSCPSSSPDTLPPLPSPPSSPPPSALPSMKTSKQFAYVSSPSAEFHIHRSVARPRHVVSDGMAKVSSMKHCGAEEPSTGGPTVWASPGAGTGPQPADPSSCTMTLPLVPPFMRYGQLAAVHTVREKYASVSARVRPTSRLELSGALPGGSSFEGCSASHGVRSAPGALKASFVSCSPHASS